MTFSTPTQTPLRWGFIGCGNISSDFANALKAMATPPTLQACAARSLSSAQDFANTHGFARAYDSYQALCDDAEVDVVYIGTLHITHYEQTLLALQHGKHVLVEKPMAMNAKQLAHMISVAQEKKLFLMEAMWTRFFPAVRHVRQLLKDKAIGDVLTVQADIGYLFAPDNERMWNKALGGGGLLDIGIYPLAFITMVFGYDDLEGVHAVGKLTEGGVDLYSSVTLTYSKNRFATATYTTLANMPETLTIVGTHGRIRIDSPAHVPFQITVTPNAVLEFPVKENTLQFPWPPVPPTAKLNFGPSQGMVYEAEAVTKAIQNLQTEHEEYPLAESLALMKIMDKVRQDIGLVYAADESKQRKHFAHVIRIDDVNANRAKPCTTSYSLKWSHLSLADLPPSPFTMTSPPSTPLRWGFIGCGKIASDFANAMKAMTTPPTFQACAARSLSSAQDFANTHGCVRAYDSYEALCADAEVDAVYVGTLNTLHYEHSLLALQHGKHVLVEKPMAMNAKQAEHMISLAQEKKLFLMEAMWTRFFPAVRHVRQLLKDKTIGDVLNAHADIGYVFPPDHANMYTNALGGGALLGIGIYPLAFVTMIFGYEELESVQAVGKLSDSAVDVYGSVTLTYSKSRFATVAYTMLGSMPETLTIVGTQGRIRIDSPAHCPFQVTVTPSLAFEFPLKENTSLFPWPPTTAKLNFDGGQGMVYEAEAVNEAIQSHQTEHEEYPLAESLALTKIMDKIRQDIGVVYAADD